MGLRRAAVAPLVAPVAIARIARIALATVRAALVALLARGVALPDVAAMGSVDLLLILRLHPRDLFGRPVESAQLLAQRFDFALVGGLLPIRFLQQLKHFVHFVDGLAQRGQDLHDFVDGLLDGFGLSRLKSARGKAGLDRALFPRGPVGNAAARLEGSAGPLGDIDFGGPREE